jgi:hypothetical protein
MLHKPNPLLLCSFLLVLPALLPAQSPGFWSPINEERIAGSGERRIVPATYRTYLLHVDELGSMLDAIPSGEEVVFAIPMPDGNMERFSIHRNTVMHPELAALFPDIRTFSGVSLERPGTVLKMDLTVHGFHAMVLPFAGDPVFIDPYATGDVEHYIVYHKSAFSKQSGQVVPHCTYEEVNDLDAAAATTAQWIGQMGDHRAGDCQKRTYRLALACTGEYANFHGSNTTNNNKSFAMAAMVTTMNRVNGMFERDATLTMVMVPNNDQLIYLNPSTDPYTNNNGSTMLGQNQTTCNNVIGSANYDIGHVFSTGGGGVAYLNSPCTSNKAGGVTGLPNPVGDPFDIDYVAHEMGHQYGGNHTQNNNCNRANVAAYEPGSASTIMGYAGICSPNVQNNSDALFHGFSMQEIAANITVGNSSGCPQITSSNNIAPTVNAGPDRTIPRSTPFILTAAASDANAGNVLTYAWEQMNNQVSTQPPLATSTSGPNFRAFLPSSSPSRYFPALSAVIANTTPTWEVLPSVGRTMTFRVTVRDNVTGAGCNAQDDVVVTVSGTAGPFLVTQPNTALSWAAGSTQTITWDVANTNASPVNCASVDILLSVDGGFTYPHVLATATPNDGSQAVVLPSIPATSTARVMVRANGNIFYDISNQNFSITVPAQVVLSAKVFLDGAYESGTGLMRDQLRSLAAFPLTEPYTAAGWSQVVGGGAETTTPAVLAVTGSNAIVDWVRIELRNPANSSQLVATRQALLQRDGDIVSTDGVSPVTIAMAPGNYLVAVRHRNHLGCMTASAVSFTGGTTLLDLTSAATSTFGTEARKTLGSVQALWAGNVVRDDGLRYTGVGNDRDPILAALGGAVPTATFAGYHVHDVNLDGVVRYTGTDNDRDPILSNIGGSIPTNVRYEQLP